MNSILDALIARGASPVRTGAEAGGKCKEPASGFEQFLDGFDVACPVVAAPDKDASSPDLPVTAEADARACNIESEPVPEQIRPASEALAFDFIALSRLEFANCLPVAPDIAGSRSQSQAKSGRDECSQNQRVEGAAVACCTIGEEEVDVLTALPPSGSRGGEDRAFAVAGGLQNLWQEQAVVREQEIQAPVAGRIRVTEIATHLPAMLADMLPAGFGTVPEASNAAGSGFGVSRFQMDQPSAGPAVLTRIVRFQVEPETLGELSVTMRLSSARVQIEIDAQTVSAASLLRHSREMLASAIEHKGVALESFDVTNRGVISPSVSAPEQAMREQMAGGSGFGGGERFGENPGSEQRRRSATREKGTRAETYPSVHGVARGVVL